MNTVLTDPKKRKLAAILFCIAAGLYIILHFILNPILAQGYSVTFWQILYLLCLAAIAVGLFLDKIPFPVAGAGFGGLAIVNFVYMIRAIRSSSRYVSEMHINKYAIRYTFSGIFSNAIAIPALRVCFVLGFLAAAAIIFLVAFGNEGMKKTAKKLAVIPFVLLLIACIVKAFSFMIDVVNDYGYGFRFQYYLRNLIMLAIYVLLLIGTKKAVEAYAYPEGKPVKTVTRANGTVTEAGDGYIGMAKHVLLLLFTFGIWLYIWIWRTTQYTNRAPGEEERNPTKKMLLCMFIPFYSIFWTYKTAQRIDAIAKTRGMSSEIATPCLVLAIFVSFVPPILMQDKINAIALKEGAPAEAPVQPTVPEAEPVSAAPVQTIADGIPEELEKYKRLLDNGVITQEEFDAKKKQLLGL